MNADLISSINQESRDTFIAFFAGRGGTNVLKQHDELVTLGKHFKIP